MGGFELLILCILFHPLPSSLNKHSLAILNFTPLYIISFFQFLPTLLLPIISLSLSLSQGAMDAVEERDMVFGSNNNDQQSSHGVVKGKRAKRQRVPLASLPSASTSSSSSAESPSNTTEEDEDMANCLILLAQGRTLAADYQDTTPAAGGGTESRFTSRRFAEATTTSDGKAGFYVYECKSCNKCFPSFQALGGHRASHKKPKIATPSLPPPAYEKKAAIDVEVDGLRISLGFLSKSTVTAMNKDNSRPRVHECSICGSEFSSGQALGGHMRRHRPLMVAESPETKKGRNVLSLDLNLPAPSDDELPRSPSASVTTAAAVAFPFKIKESLVLPLVDCHY